MNTKTTFVVLLIAIGLAIYFFAFEGKTTTTQQKEQEQAQQADQVGQPLLKSDQLPSAKVSSITIEKPGEMPVKIAVSGDDWTQTAPVKFKLQSWQSRDLLDKATALRYTASFTPADRKVDLDTLGLNPPQATLTYSGDGFDTLTLCLGKSAGAGRSYLTLGKPDKSAKVYVVNDDLNSAIIGKSVRDMRDHSLASFTPGKARQIDLKYDDQHINLAERDGRWALTQPVNGRASTQKAHDIVQALTTASVDSFVTDQPKDLSAFGLDKPSTTLKIDVVEAVTPPKKSGDKADQKVAKKADEQPQDKIVTHTLIVGSPTDLSGDKFFAMYDDIPAVFTLNKSDVDKLHVKIDDLRDPKLTPVARSDVRDITVEQPNHPKLHLTKDQAWTFGDPKPGFDLDRSKMSDLLDAIFNTKATDYVDLAKTKPGAPIATITMGVLAHTEPEVLKVFTHGDNFMVVRGSETVGYVVPHDKLQLALAPALALRDRIVLDLTADQITAVDVNRSGKYPAEYHLKRAKGEKDKPGDWEMTGLDDTAVHALLDALTPVRATEFLAAKTVTTPEGVSLTIHTADGKTHKLFVHTDSSIATLDGVDDQFKVPADVVTASEAEMRDRLMLNLTDDQIAKVKTGENTVYRDENGKYTMTGPGEMDEPTVAKIWDNLAKLMALHIVDKSSASGEPSATIEITTRDGKTHTLKIWQPKDQPAVAQLDGDKTFTLPPGTAKAITDSPQKSAHPAAGNNAASKPGLPNIHIPGLTPEAGQ